MKLKFKESAYFESVSGMNGDEPIITKESFTEGQVIDAEVVQRDFELRTITIQMNNGSIIYGVPESIVDIEEEICSTDEIEG